MSFTRAIAVVLLSSGCSSSLEPALEGKACTGQGYCVEGFVCNAEQRCVRPDLALTGSQDDGASGAGVTPAPIEPYDAAVESAPDADARVPDEPMNTVDGPRCAGGLSMCGALCIDLASNARHCGRCDARCEPPPHGRSVCVSGACDFVCELGFTRCADACVDLRSDRASCGKCGHVCDALPNADSTCRDGACVDTCEPGFAPCDHEPLMCVDLMNDVENCGACGHACLGLLGIATVCDAGQCSLLCPTGKIECAGACVDTTSDRRHCGKCGKVCRDADLCMEGECKGRGKGED